MPQTAKLESSPVVASVDEEGRRWSMAQTVMVATVLSLGLWALILFGGRWLIG